jgi:beta-N-acetylhexosaminidase
MTWFSMKFLRPPAAAFALWVVLCAASVSASGWAFSVLNESGAPGGAAPYGRALTPGEEAWVRQTLASLSLDEKIGQMMVVAGNPTYFSRDSEKYRELERAVTEYKVGGVIWFRGDVWATAMLTNRLQRTAKTPLLVSADLEMGMGMRFNDTLWFPPNMAVAATGDEKWARIQGEMTARQARAVGVNWIYAPVVDINSNPNNPVINTRSYGESPEAVARFAAAFADGAQSAGVMACAKHFPGHGDTALDSHIGLPVVDISRERLESLELVPFRALAKRGVGSIMSAHIALPQIESEPAAPLRPMSAQEREGVGFASRTEGAAPNVTLPATLSQKILTGILREDIGFSGLIVTDAMRMAGVTARYASPDAAVRAVRAGADVILLPPDLPGVIAALRHAVEANDIPLERVNRSVERILRAKAALELSARRTVDLDEVDAVVDGQSVQAAAQEIADRSMTLVRDAAGTFRALRAAARAGADATQSKAKPRILTVTYNGDDDPIGNLDEFHQWLRRGFDVTRVTMNLRSREADIPSALSVLDGQTFDAVVFAVAVRAQSGKGDIALPKVGAALAATLLKRTKNVIVLSFGTPYLLAATPDATTYAVAYSLQLTSQRAAARALLGDIDVTGRLPISLPGLYPRHHGIDVRER